MIGRAVTLAGSVAGGVFTGWFLADATRVAAERAFEKDVLDRVDRRIRTVAARDDRPLDVLKEQIDEVNVQGVGQTRRDLADLASHVTIWDISPGWADLIERLGDPDRANRIRDALIRREAERRDVGGSEGDKPHEDAST